MLRLRKPSALPRRCSSRPLIASVGPFEVPGRRSRRARRRRGDAGCVRVCPARRGLRERRGAASRSPLAGLDVRRLGPDHDRRQRCSGRRPRSPRPLAFGHRRSLCKSQGDPGVSSCYRQAGRDDGAQRLNMLLAQVSRETPRSGKAFRDVPANQAARDAAGGLSGSRLTHRGSSGQDSCRRPAARTGSSRSPHPALSALPPRSTAPRP